MSGNFKEFTKGSDYIKYFKAKSAMKKLPITEFDVADEPDGKITKKFVRVKGEYITQMYTDISRSSQHNYITCVDNLIYDEKIDRQEFNSMKISCILKTPPSDTYNVIVKTSEAERATMAELVCSRVANLLNIKTEYVAPIVNNPYGCIIVDFLKGKEKVESFTDFTKISPSSYLSEFDIGNWISPLVNETFFRIPGALENPHLAGDQIYPMVEDFSRQYLFKKYIVHDADLCSVNVGVITSPNGDISIAPAYDFEQCLMPGIRTAQGQGRERDLMLLAKNYPKILEKIAKDFSLDADKKNELIEIINTFCIRDDLKREYYDLIVNSCLNFSVDANNFLGSLHEKCN